MPPQTGAIAAFGDTAGNLGEEWDIAMSEGTARSSMIRREMGAAAVPMLGTAANGWVLASATALSSLDSKVTMVATKMREHRDRIQVVRYPLNCLCSILHATELLAQW